VSDETASRRAVFGSSDVVEAGDDRTRVTDVRREGEDAAEAGGAGVVGECGDELRESVIGDVHGEGTERVDHQQVAVVDGLERLEEADAGARQVTGVGAGRHRQRAVVVDGRGEDGDDGDPCGVDAEGAEAALE
jgi:hypothetical protein